MEHRRRSAPPCSAKRPRPAQNSRAPVPAAASTPTPEGRPRIRRVIVHRKIEAPPGAVTLPSMFRFAALKVIEPDAGCCKRHARRHGDIPVAIVHGQRAESILRSAVPGDRITSSPAVRRQRERIARCVQRECGNRRQIRHWPQKSHAAAWARNSECSTCPASERERQIARSSAGTCNCRGPERSARASAPSSATDGAEIATEPPRSLPRYTSPRNAARPPAAW